MLILFFFFVVVSFLLIAFVFLVNHFNEFEISDVFLRDSFYILIGERRTLEWMPKPSSIFNFF